MSVPISRPAGCNSSMPWYLLGGSRAEFTEALAPISEKHELGGLPELAAQKAKT